MLKDIMDYEKRLLADRQELLRLTEEHLAEDDEAVQDKLKFFRNELMHLNHQYELLRREVDMTRMRQMQAQPGVQPQPQAKPVQPQVSQPQVPPMQQSQPVQPQVPPIQQSQTVEPQVSQPQAQPVEPQVSQPQAQPVQAQVQQPTQAPPLQNFSQQQIQPQEQSKSSQKFFGKDTSNLEKTVGTSLMGILASGLIFVSLILFATVLMPYMTEEVKLAGCYTVSIAITGFALVKLQKDAENKFYLTLAGCGVGALYISLLLTNIYFKFIGDIPLFILIAVWVAFVCYLSKAKNKIFHLIGQLGVTISIIFGCCLCVDKNDMVKFVSLSIYYIIAFGTLYVTHWEREFARNKIANIFGCVNLVWLYIAAELMIEEAYNPYHIFMVVVLLAHLVMVFIAKWEETKISYGIFASFYAFMLALACNSFVHIENISGIAMYLIAMVIYFVVEYKEKDFEAGQTFAQIAMILQALIGVGMIDKVFEHGFVVLLVLPPLLLGYFRRNAVSRGIALVMMYIYLFIPTPNIEQFIVGIIALVVFYGLVWWQKEFDSFGYKIALHLLGMTLLSLVGWGFLKELDVSYDTRNAIVFIALAIFNTVMSKSCFAKNLWTKEPEDPILYNIMNLVLMTAGLVIISGNTILHIPVILVTLVLFILNSKNLLEEYPNVVSGIYVGLKITVLMIVILDSFEATNYVVSSCCILLAIASIIVGFMKNYKYLRIYGLILSMISVFKLIMIDIHYENTLGNAVSFFISGILCFAISMIYNYIDKKMKKEE